ncbi:MAG: hypothetical protein R3C59_11525 [Planctomycetaceae bacterium]
MILRITTLACVCLSLISAVSAQQPHHSEIIVGHQGISTLKADLSYLLSLTTPTEQAQEENLVGFIELMELGVQQDQPIRVDILTGTNPPTYLISAGHTDPLQDLFDNLDGAGFVVRPSGANLWEVLPPDKGWLRALPTDKVAILVFDKASDHDLLKQIVTKMSNPLPAVKPLLEGGSNIAIQLTNKAKTPADQKLRRDSFSELRAVSMDTLQKRPSEAVTAFNLRRQIAENQLNEIERLLVEADTASARIVMDRKASSATVSFAATAIPDTSFAATLGQFQNTPDRFASVKKAAGSVLSVRGNHPIDEMRKGHANIIMKLLNEDAMSRLEKNAKLSAKEKEASQKLFDGIMEVAKDSVGTGNLNGFLETVLKGEDNFVSYAAINVKDGQRLDRILALINETGKDNSFKPAVAKVGDVSIHEVKLAKGYFKPFDVVFDGKTGYVGVSDSIVWFGTGGTDALEPLKAAIADLKPPAESNVVLSIEGNLLPWAKRAKKIIEAEPEPTASTEQTRRRDALRHLGLAIEAFSAKDDARFSMQVKDGKASGEIFVNTGVLRFIGKALSSYSRTNLE